MVKLRVTAGVWSCFLWLLSLQQQRK